MPLCGADGAAQLIPTEHRLLAYLVRNEGRIVSYHELLEAMSVDNPSVNSLRHYISRLCKKIEIDPALPSVITNRGQGYSFAGKEEGRWFPELEGYLGSQ